MKDNTKNKLAALQNLIDIMREDKDLPRDLQLTFQDIHDYIVRNK